ncbi:MULTISPECIES: TonB-dependent receptor domain-containing protein [Sphingobium]|uniref:TonB-dependent receptor n=1 Tax=Sphingobium fuliginis (strain ATCC 27551) TaxID=336203 RepID=A0ABQ1ERU2_SPHSA|nr:MULTISPECIES: TonB-dependent receptor [Sphingobium]RYL99405.1 TonB-dependent receptor [Sphingobium fuliginis]WDA36773.1 TonB-dependent receptor [Sphingobium sp. YC-XJ3]GFZ84594.1 TonB-dependent receptor [Sphingobium fuliginis]
MSGKSRSSWTFAPCIRAALCCCALAPASVGAQERPIHVEPAPLAEALTALSRQTGIAIGFEGRLPGLRSRHVDGRMTVEQALARMLEGTGLEARRLSPTAYRLVQAAPPASRRDPVRPAPPLPPEGSVDIIVTGTKREEPLARLPISVAIVQAPGEQGGALLPGTEEVAQRLDGLTLTNLGPGRNRQFIRGVADSPFNGNSQSTVAILINDARATYNAPDPDLKLVDVERVELLKGPQGSLYGTGTLGGVYHIVTRPPDAGSFAAMAGMGASLATHGEMGGSAEAMVNLPVVADRLALRAVAYAVREPGWIDTAGRGDANRGELRGGRVALRALAGDWTVDLNGMAQMRDVADSQYVYARHALERPAQPAEPHDNDFALMALRVAGKLGGANLVYAGNWVDHDVSSTLDASDLSASAFGIAAPALYLEQRRNRLFDQEVRLSQTRDDGLSWLAGLSFVDVRNHLSGVVRGVRDETVGTGIQGVVEFSAFGDMRMPLTGALSLSVGGRLFHSRIEEEQGARHARIEASVARSGFTPSLALSWQAGVHDFFYARYAGALRPGGLSRTGAASAERFESDELQTVEMGWRHSASAWLTVNLDAFLTTWSHMQSDYLLADGLIGTRNVGDARIRGVEASVDWKPAAGWAISAGLVGQSALLTRTNEGLRLEDRHLPVVPDWKARLGVNRHFDLSGWSGSMGVNLAYLGPSRLSFDPGLDRRMGDYALANADLALRRKDWSIRLSGSNLLDCKADSFAFGNPFALARGTQYTPLRPRQWAVGLTKNW